VSELLRMLLTVLPVILALNLLDQTQDVAGVSPTCRFFTGFGPINAVNLAKSKKKELLINLSTCLEANNEMDPNGFFFTGTGTIGVKEINYTGLMLAARAGLNDIAEHYINISGIDLNAQEPVLGWTAALLAAGNGNLGILNVLLDIGVDIEHQAKDGTTALIIAAMNGRSKAVRSLLKKGANVNQRGLVQDTALGFAARKQYDSIVDALLEFNANVNFSNEYGLTPLHWAAEVGALGIVQTLVLHGADISKSNKFGLTPLHMAAKNGHSSIVHFLLKKGAKIKVGPEIEKNGMCWAILGKSCATVKLLESHGGKCENDHVQREYSDLNCKGE